MHPQTKFSDETCSAVIECLSHGLTLRETAREVGVYHKTIDTWRERRPWFDTAVKNAIALAPGRVTRATFDACVASMHAGATGHDAARNTGASYEGVRQWAARNGLAREFRAALAASALSRRAPAKVRRKRTPVEKVDDAMSDRVIDAVAERVRSGEALDSAVLAELGKLPARYWDWQRAHAERAAPITVAVAWVRQDAARRFATGLLTPAAQQAMHEAVSNGRGWNGIAKAVGTYADKLKGWCSGPFINDEHRRAAERLVHAWERERERRASPSAMSDERARKARDSRLRGTYGITLLEAEAMLSAQGGGCAVCSVALRPIGHKQDPKDDARSRPVVDHCHDTSRVRGILCAPCNAGIGMMGERYETLERAARYLRTAQATTSGVTISDRGAKERGLS